MMEYEFSPELSHGWMRVNSLIENLEIVQKEAR
jgi:hypothetical protein